MNLTALLLAKKTKDLQTKNEIDGMDGIDFEETNRQCMKAIEEDAKLDHDDYRNQARRRRARARRLSER
jgi:predicted P-loop ATPase